MDVGEAVFEPGLRRLACTRQYLPFASRQWAVLCQRQSVLVLRKGDADKRLSPDVYVIAGVDPDKAVPSWQLWKLKTPPLFALEIVSENVNKDYVLSPSAYEHTKVQELVVFDPEAPKLIDASRGRSRVRWQIWRRDTKGAWRAPLQSTLCANESETPTPVEFSVEGEMEILCEEVEETRAAAQKVTHASV